ncbi:hypothetical protein OHT52_21330 [Streptomyces sp. NBC_00247]|uniref:hypothetical protein n=1 Tax=Streptomyces sp. NBC_00247 TaxID=2975689 RepID=UPI002E2C4D4D|nr:hypothetical protein [Streptomyces sp. NBC_00247]
MTSLTDPFAAPGRNRPAPSPAAVALAVQCRKAKAIADNAGARFDDMPTPITDASAAGGEVQLVVRPRTLADWARWTTNLGIDARRTTNTGTATVCRFELDGVRARLIGVGVPALYATTFNQKGAHRA